MNSQDLRYLLPRLWHHVGVVRQRQFLLLLLLMLLSGLAEIVSLGMVLPFIGVLAAPDTVMQYRFVDSFARATGISTGAELVLPLTIAFATAAVLAGAVRLLLVRVSTRITFLSGSDLSIEIYRRTLYQPYSVHVGRSSSEMISGIANKVGNTVLGVMLPMITLISSIVLLVAIMSALIAINYVVALVAVGGFGGSYLIISWFARWRLKRNGERIANEQTQVVKALQEGLGGIRDVLLDGSQPVFCDVYRRADRPLRVAVGDNVFLGQFPRFAIEAVGMVLIAILAYVLSFEDGGIAAALPSLVALALGAQRLLPALQQGYSSWASVAGSQATLVDTIELLDQPLPNDMLQAAPPPLVFQEDIKMRKLRFRYTDDGPWVLDGLDVTVKKGARVGIVGATGSGKSTLLDLLMGLLTATEGEITVDNEPLVGRRTRAWQMSLAHVPQNIYLADSTLAENIAFGVPRHEINMGRVRQAASQAQIAEFIENGPLGYEAMVGERGVRLSGGQRQRIGVARALYKDASVLILDEATSALDNTTEMSVMSAIDKLSRDLTILIIAHRLSTVQRCDSIVVLEGGRVVAQGNYDELLASSQSFQQMAQAATLA
ncbi:MAG: ABC transporter ATP-binding protein [Woeseiaceae bacterium]